MELINKGSYWVAGLGLVAMVVITCAEVVSRRATQHPILGSFELVAQLMILVTWFAIAYTQSQRGHIVIGVLVERFPQRIKLIAEAINYFLCLGIFSLITWQCVVLGMTFSNHHQVTETLKWPLAYFVYIGTFGLVMMCVVLLAELCNVLVRLVKK
jgi:TRAP-type C4-dicarboxylate transport system permease small subunit